MKVLINERLSEHKYKTPEGYLICQDAILARTGKQTYRRNEVFNDSSDEEVEVDRKPEQVFSPQTLASFENKPVTVEHPDEDVNPNNYKEYSVGFVRDVHKGVADGQDVILGTLVITDAKTIEEIENGEHTELSCGYDCDIEDNDAPEQKNIRGNHVALCEQGRAGIARIVDSVKIEDRELVPGVLYTTKAGGKLLINKITAILGEMRGDPELKIEYSYTTPKGRKGTSTCYSRDFWKMLTDPNVTGDSLTDDSDVKDESPTYQFYRKEILKAKTKAEMDDLEFNIEEDYDKKKLTEDEYRRLYRSMNSLRTTLDSVEDDYDAFKDLRRRILATKDDWYKFNLLLKTIERAKNYGSLLDREAEILIELWNEKKKEYYNMVANKAKKDEEIVEDAEENYSDLRKRILNTKNNKDEFEGILNRIERSKSAKTISEIEANLLKKFWNEKKEQYYPKNPVQKVEGMVIEYIDGIDHQKKYIRVKTGTYSKAQGIYRVLQSKNPKKYSSQYGLIPMGGSQVQEWKPFMQTHPNVKFEEVYDMKDAKNYSKMNDLGYQYFENRLRENGAKIKHTHVQSENPYTLIYDVELEGSAHKLRFILQTMSGSLKRYGIDMTYDLNENYPPKAKIITKVTSMKDSMTKDMSDEDYEDLIDDLLDAGITNFDEGRTNNYQALYFYNRGDLEKAKRIAGRYAHICKMKGEKDSITKDDFSTKSRQGYSVERIERANSGRYYAILKRPMGDYVVAAGYDIKDGTWGQGYYDYKTYEDALKGLKKAKTRAGDSVKDLTFSSEFEKLKEKIDNVRNAQECINLFKEIKSKLSSFERGIAETRLAATIRAKGLENQYIETLCKNAKVIKEAPRGYAIVKRDDWKANKTNARILKWGPESISSRRQLLYEVKANNAKRGGEKWEVIGLGSFPVVEKLKNEAWDDSKSKDAMPVYEIRWIDLIEKSKGYPDYKYLAEIKANSLREALRKLHDRVVLAGTGSHNCLVMNVKGNGKTYMYTGRLDELLKQNPQDSKGIKTKELD